MTTLALKPTKRQIIELITQAVNKRQNERRQELEAQRQEVLSRVHKREKAWENQAIQKALEHDEKLVAVRKFGKKHGLTEATRYDEREKVVRIVVQVSHVVPIADLKMPPYPVQSKEESEEASRIYSESHNLKQFYDDHVIEYLMQQDTELMTEVEAIAAKISASVQRESAKVTS